MSLRSKRSLAAFTTLLVSFLLYCAKISPPPGGPVDKTGAEVLATTPANGATKVAKSDVISIDFSEAIAKQTVENAIFISPSPSTEPKLKWKGKTLLIVLADSLAENTTYVINIGSEIKDLRNNPMANSYTFAFSTGDSVDAGKIQGTIFQEGKTVSGIAVGLFDFERPDSRICNDSLYPSYLTLSGKEGEYALEFLPDGRYFVLAFDDKNKNRLLDFPAESFGVPDKTIVIAASHPEARADLYLSRADTSAISILSATASDVGLLKARFSRAITTDSIRNNLDRIVLISPSDSLHVRHPQSVKEKFGALSANYSFYFADLPEGDYRLRVPATILGRRKEAGGEVESGLIKYKPGADDNPPALESVSHSGRTVFPSEKTISVCFSEPVRRNRLDSAAVRVTDSDSSLYELNFIWPDDFNLDLSVRDLAWGKACALTVNTADVIDLSGKSAGDSIAQFVFHTYYQDSLGLVSGTIDYAPDIDTGGIAYLTFTSISSDFSRTEPVLGTAFNIQMPPGKYILHGYLDRNGNGARDLGSLCPFDYAETASIYPDTVRVRARFETAELEFIFK
jgi:uncharacterized protein (DUF2141 family)